MIKELMKKYDEVRDEIRVIKANGSLSKLINLREEFDTTFDYFFDRKELREKYTINNHDAWDKETDTMNTDVTNTDLLDNLTDEDTKDFIEFLQDEISLLQEELNQIS